VLTFHKLLQGVLFKFKDKQLICQSLIDKRGVIAVVVIDTDRS